MKPLPDLPNRDEGPDPTATRAVWTLVFMGLGTMIMANLPPERGGWWIIAAGVSFGAAARFFYLLVVRRNR